MKRQLYSPISRNKKCNNKMTRIKITLIFLNSKKQHNKKICNKLKRKFLVKIHQFCISKIQRLEILLRHQMMSKHRIIAKLNLGKSYVIQSLYFSTRKIALVKLNEARKAYQFLRILIPVTLERL